MLVRIINNFPSSSIQSCFSLYMTDTIFFVLTSCAGNVENILFQNCNIFSVLSVFKYNPGKQIINLSLLNNFYPTLSYRRVQKESDELLYTVWSLVMVRSLVASASG